MINSRKLEDLAPEVESLARAFIELCGKDGIDVLITSTFRDLESQAALYAQGRTTAGKIVTNAEAGHSYHNFRVAFDFVPLVNGKPQWDDLETYRKCGALAESLGLEWAGRWHSFPELAHCQFTGGRTLADFRAQLTDGGVA